MRWNIIVECIGEDGKQSTIRWAPSNGSPGVPQQKPLRESKQIVNRFAGYRSKTTAGGAL